MNMRVKVGLLVAVAAGIALAGWWLASPDKARSNIEFIKAEERRYNDAAQSKTTGIEFLSLTPDLQLQQIEALITLAPVDQKDQALNAAQLASLRAHAGQWLHAKFVNRDPAVYRGWMERAGYVLKDRKELDLFGIDRIYQYATGAPIGSATLPEAFDAMWIACRDRPRHDWQPEAIASSADGLTIVTGKFTRGDTAPTRLTGTLGPEFWRGVSNASTPVWIKMGAPRTEVVLTHGTMVYAQVGFAVRLKNGSVVPTVATFAMSPVDGRWHLELFHRYNYPVAKLGPETL